MLKLKSILLSVIIFFVASCASIKNGRYVTLIDQTSAEKLSELFHVPAWKIKEANKDKLFKKGEVLFIPSKGGIIANNTRSVASVDYSLMKKSSRFLWPVPSSGRISSNFGHRWGRKHEGIDIPARAGAYILAADDGVVVYSGHELSGYGNITVMSHKDGFFTVYAHASKNMTKKGDKISKGQVIATVGSTGKSTGNHLHFEIRRDSLAFNPAEFYNL